MTERATSVYGAALAELAPGIHPVVWNFLSGPHEAGLTLRAEGVFRVVDGKLWWAAGLMRLVFGPGVVLPHRGRDVPFTLTGRTTRAADGSLRFTAVREFRFDRGVAVFQDEVSVAGPGRVRDLLGASQRIEALLEATITGDAGVRMRAVRTRIRVLRWWLTLPNWLGVRLDGVDGFNTVTGLHTIDVVAALPGLGTIMEYRGEFTPRWVRE